MENPIKLAPSEHKTLTLLALGKHYHDIRRELEISSVTLHTRLHNIRKKTGIMNTRDTEQCQHALERCEPLPDKRRVRTSELGPTPKQIACLRLYAQGKSHRDIAHALNIGQQSAMNAVCQGKARASITEKRDPRKAVAVWLASGCPLSTPDATGEELPDSLL